MLRTLRLLARACAVTIAAALPALAAHAAPVQVSPSDQKTLAPDIAVGPKGEIYVLWLDKEPKAASTPTTEHANPDRHVSTMDLYLARSDDGGRTFAAPVRVNDKPGEVWGFATSRPRMAVSGAGTVHVLWPANAIGAVGKPILEIHYARSTDAGRSFEPARRMNTTVQGDLSSFMHGGYAVAHAFQALAADRSGIVTAAWIDTRDMRSASDNGAIYRAISRDDGRTWGADEKVFGDVCPCCQLTLAGGRDSDLYLGTRKVEPGNFRQSSVARSTDHGMSFGERVSTGGPRWQLDGCPLKPTMIATDGKHVYTAVFNGGGQPQGVYFSASHDRAAHFEPAIAVHPDAAVSDSPAVAVGKGGDVHVAWHAKTGDVRRLFTRVSRDHGRSFGAVTEIPTPPGAAQYPMLAASPTGEVFVTWQQGEQVWVDRLD